MRTWERGAGLTQACGTAACAAAVAAARRELAGRKVKVTLPGGDLLIDWREGDGHILMTGPYALDFEGTLPARAVPAARLIASRAGLTCRTFHVRSRLMSLDIEIITFGCRLNAYESEVMREHANAAGLSDAVIVNTCAVTAEAVRQARQAIRKARRMRPDAKIVVTGCAAQIDPDRFAAMARSITSSAITRRRNCSDVPGALGRGHREGRGQRHHVGAARPRCI